MDEGQRRTAATKIRGDRPSRVPGRPVRTAGWAALAVLALTLAAGTAAASDTGGTTTTPDCPDSRFGDRQLKLGDCGDDVTTLNWLMKPKPYSDGIGLDQEFKAPTDAAVKELQTRAELPANGVVNRRTRQELKAGMGSQIASWYGPGFWGNETACGQTLKRRTIGVAHKRLPCGTKVTFNKGGRWLRTKVIDRGPYVKGRTWDLTQRAAEALGMEYTETVRASAIVKPDAGGDDGGGGGRTGT